jgi:hypothetical protein
MVQVQTAAAGPPICWLALPRSWEQGQIALADLLLFFSFSLNSLPPGSVKMK